MNRISTFLAVCLLLAFCTSVSAGTWTVTNLNPQGATSSAIYGVTSTQQAGSVNMGGVTGAAVWGGTPASVAVVHPSAAPTYSRANAMSSNQQGGYAVIGGIAHASLWTGTADSWVDLRPGSTLPSYVQGMSGNQQGGYVYTTPTNYHAALWTGTADSFVDLNPGNSIRSEVYAVCDGRQAGFANTHAGYWSGTASSWVDLHNWGESSCAYGISDDQEVGIMKVYGYSHAVVWNDTAASMVILEPTGAYGSAAYAVSGGYQVGEASFNSAPYTRAGMWSGTAASWFDLGALLPSGIYTNSVATSIQTAGGEIWIGGYAYSKLTGQSNAILWHLVPEPSSLLALAGALASCAGLAKRRRRIFSPDSQP